MSYNLQIITWDKIRDNVKDIDPQLTQCIDNLSPGNEYKIYKLDCPWGQHLLHEGTLCIPNSDGKWVKLNDSSIDPKIAMDLSYNKNMPLGIVLNNSVELYMNVLGRIAPWAFMPKGTIFGLWLSFQQDKSTTNQTGQASNIVAGSRSTFLLPKISDTTSFKKLKKTFGLQTSIPETFSDQWRLFRELSQHKDFPQQWTATVIYFSREWIRHKEDVAWRLFKLHLLEIAWGKMDYVRNQVVFDLAFSCALEKKNLKPNPYLTDTVKHIFAIAQNNYPAYEIATDNFALPLEAFQAIFTDLYTLKYHPTIMVPGYLTNTLKSLYYSLEVPTLMSFSPKSRKNLNKLEDLREIKHIIERTIDYLREDRLRIKEAYRLVDEVNFEYYHTDEDIHMDTNKTSDLTTVDKSIMQHAQNSAKPFCNTSPFLRGCVRIYKLFD